MRLGRPLSDAVRPVQQPRFRAPGVRTAHGPPGQVAAGGIRRWHRPAASEVKNNHSIYLGFAKVALLDSFTLLYFLLNFLSFPFPSQDLPILTPTVWSIRSPTSALCLWPFTTPRASLTWMQGKDQISLRVGECPSQPSSYSFCPLLIEQASRSALVNSIINSIP